MNVSLTPQSEAIVKRLLERDNRAPEQIIEQALQQMEEADNLKQLWVELLVGEQSGESVPFDLARIKARVFENIRNGVKVRQSAALPPIDN